MSPSGGVCLVTFIGRAVQPPAVVCSNHGVAAPPLPFPCSPRQLPFQNFESATRRLLEKGRGTAAFCTAAKRGGCCCRRPPRRRPAGRPAILRPPPAAGCGKDHCSADSPPVRAVPCRSGPRHDMDGPAGRIAGCAGPGGPAAVGRQSGGPAAVGLDSDWLTCRARRRRRGTGAPGPDPPRRRRGVDRWALAESRCRGSPETEAGRVPEPREPRDGHAMACGARGVMRSRDRSRAPLGPCHGPCAWSMSPAGHGRTARRRPNDVGRNGAD